MKCIFCKQNSDGSNSIEHIVPESLGNKEHILPKGVVCDKCNNYFATKIEKPLMELPYFVSVRHRNLIENKKGRVPVEVGFLMGGDGFQVNFHADNEGRSISFGDEKAIDYIKTRQIGKIIALVNEFPPEDDQSISRLLGKIALEAIAKIAIDVEGGLDDILNNSDLDILRNYVRFGNKIKFWPYSIRPIYPEQQFIMHIFEEQPYEILHEYHLFQTETNIWHICLIMFGIEYCLNMCEPVQEDYQNWLKENNGRSPLY